MTSFLSPIARASAPALAFVLCTGLAIAQTPTPEPAPGSAPPPVPAAPTAPGPVPASPPSATPPNGLPGPSSQPAPATPSGPAPAAPPAGAPPAPAAAPAPVQPIPPRAGGTPAIVVDVQDFESIMGKNVRSAADEEMGRIVDVIVGVTGEPKAAVIDFGGFLGVGSRKVAVDWKAMQFATGGKIGRITLALTRAQVRLSPEFKPGEPIVILGATAPGPEASADQAKPKTDP